MNPLPLAARWEPQRPVAEWSVVRQQALESPAQLPAAQDAAARPVWQACLPLAGLQAGGQESEQRLPADSGVAHFLRAQIDARRVKLRLAVGPSPEMCLQPDSAFARAPFAAPGPRLE